MWIGQSETHRNDNNTDTNVNAWTKRLQQLQGTHQNLQKLKWNAAGTLKTDDSHSGVSVEEAAAEQQQQHLGGDGVLRELINQSSTSSTAPINDESRTPESAGDPVYWTDRALLHLRTAAAADDDDG